MGVIKDIDFYFKNGHKKGDTSSYGKFITLYPPNDDIFIKSIKELYELLKQFEGPYILSDKRYNDCKCLYYRYGNNLLDNIYDSKGIVKRFIRYKGHEYLDLPTGYYNVPDFIVDPLDSTTSPDTSSYLLLKYNIKEGISFSPIGGVYKANEKNKQFDCIVKEFYPHTGILDEENDSFTIYRNEVGNLKRLQKFKFVPRIIENFQDWDNYYLVEEFIDGDSLESYAAQYNTIVLGFDFIQVKKYIIKILNLFLKIVENVIELYKDGYIFTDLAPDNIIINQAGVYFIDLESVHEINDDKDVFSYTLNFYDKNKTDDENIKLSISNLLLFCFNKKSTLFDIFNADQILDPIIRRYPDIIEILHLINNINNPKSNVMEIKNFIHETLNKIHLLPDKKKLDIKREDKISLSDSKYSISPNSLSFDGYINNRIINKNSIAFGTLGQFLAANYIFDKKFEENYFKEYISDYRTNSFFYGHSGLLYILNLNRIKCNEVLLKILKNIDFSDKSLQTGISGIGISLLHSYSIRKDDRVKKVIKDIKVNLNNASIKDFDNTLENGKLGIALFYIYHYHIFESNSSLSKAIEYLDDVLLEFQDSKYKKSLAKNINSEFYEYYIANGICGLILVLIEFMQKTNDSRYFSKMEYFAKLCKGIYSTSPCFLRGSAGFLYTFYKIYKNFKLNKEFRIEVVEQIEQFYLDIINMILDGKIYDVNFDNHEKNFFGGKEGILTILDLVNKDSGNLKIFPFIL